MWKHLRAIILLPGMVTLVIPGIDPVADTERLIQSMAFLANG